MQTVPHTEIEHARASDIGRIALHRLGGDTLAIADTLDECVRIAEKCTGERITLDSIDTHTDLSCLTSADLVAVEIGPAD